MTVMTRQNTQLLEQLIGLAGSSEVVERTLRDLNQELGRPPQLREVVKRILETTKGADTPTALAG